ncbi:tail fiber domain-containing protein, partial [Fusobacterium necrophorum]
FAKQDTSVSFQNITASGDILAQGTVTGLSDKRLKQNIEKIQNPLKILKKLNGYTFIMNKERHVGVIAQEVQKALPEAVRETENGYLSVAYGNMVGLLIEANKELLKRIEVLEHVIKQ